MQATNMGTEEMVVNEIDKVIALMNYGHHTTNKQIRWRKITTGSDKTNDSFSVFKCIVHS